MDRRKAPKLLERHVRFKAGEKMASQDREGTSPAPKERKHHAWRRWLNTKKSRPVEVPAEPAESRHQRQESTSTVPSPRHLASPLTASPTSSNPDKPLPLPPPPWQRHESPPPVRHRKKSSRRILEPLDDSTVRALFSGAPHFNVQPALHAKGKARPEVSFPWDLSLDIRDSSDCPPLLHPSFSLSTSRKHLPRPDHRLVIEGRQPNFDPEVVERPSMVTAQGTEPGSCGFEHYLELAIADSFRVDGHTVDAEGMSARGRVNRNGFSRRDDKHMLRRAGLAKPETHVIIERLRYLGDLFHILREDASNHTISAVHSSVELYTELFTRLLYPPTRVAEVDSDDPYSFRVQISGLVHALNAESIWLDFTATESRLYIGQILWGAGTQLGSEGAEPGVPVDAVTDEERYWLLYQTLLACELLMRLESVAKNDGIIDDSGLRVSQVDLTNFDKDRNSKIGWDLILARRWLENIRIVRHGSTEIEQKDQPEVGKSVTRTRLSSESSAAEENDSLLRQLDKCQFLPRHISRQAAGLSLFAQNIQWPQSEKIESLLIQSLEASPGLSKAPGMPFEERGPEAPSEHEEATSTAVDETLQTPRTDVDYKSMSWISRAWLAGLFLPGEAMYHILMATLLENGDDRFDILKGRTVSRGGFVYDVHSWWSHKCIVGRVFAPLDGSSECAGWIYCPDAPASHPDGWIEIHTEPIDRKGRQPRILDAEAMARESSVKGSEVNGGPLWPGDMTLPVDPPWDADVLCVSAPSLTLRPRSSGAEASSSNGSCQLAAFTCTLTFETSTRDLTLDLDGASTFISAFPCHPHPPSEPTSHLPAHPLHKSQAYQLLPLTALVSTGSEVNVLAGEGGVKVVDARGAVAHQILARASCSRWRVDAVIARVGTTCIACAVREALALGVGVVLRVGDSTTV
ncbi:MAG: hypothetical protein M1825_002556 [Sarcosagium campestre]|nr:MAG: hypothetical protein M1825_002556 [Sarcosagium campestre]